MRELSLAFRRLLGTPFVTIVAVLSLGLGIGANSAIFSLFNQVLLRPLPVDAPELLVNLGSPDPKNGSTSSNNAGNSDQVFSYPMFLDLASEQQVFTAIAAHRPFGANVGHDGDTRTEDGVEVSGTYFGVLGLQPALGRLIAPADTETIDGAPVVVLSHACWTSRFNQDRSVIGQSLVVNGQALTVIGVAPAGFDGTTRGTRQAVFVPITLRGLMEAGSTGFDQRNNYWVYLFARLAPGVTMETARAGINVPYQAILTEVELPQMTMSDARRTEFAARRVSVEDGRRGQSYLLGRAQTPLLILQAVTAVVLLIACANIANLLLARSAGRAAEMAIRLSIGASRARLVRQLLVESCLLAALGGLAGLVILRWTVQVVASRLPFGTLDPAVSQVSGGVLPFAAGLSLTTGVVFGLFPALHATRPDLASTLKGQAGQPSGARSAARFRSALVVVQIALSMGLLTTAGLFTRSLMNVSRVDLGVEIDQVLTFRLDPRRNGYDAARVRQFFDDVLVRLASTPGVTDVSAAVVPLLAGSISNTGITVEGFEPAEGERTSTSFNIVSPGYFSTTGMPLLAGRDVAASDTDGAPGVAVVNEAFARRFGLGQNPVGRRMRRGSGGNDPLGIEIVGVVRDAKYSEVRADVPPVFFLPLAQINPSSALSFYVKAARDPETLKSEIRTLIASMDPNLPVQRLYTMPEQVAENVSSDRVLSTLSAAFAGLATALAAIGLYGVLAYTVSQRTREFGLRMALGASPVGLQVLVLRQVLWMTLIGGLVGLALATGTGYMARALLFEMGSADPVVLAASTAALVCVSLAAGYIPSRRASRVDPMRALRWE